LTDWPSLPWPQVDAARLDLWAPVVVGVDELGRWVTITLPERNLLLGGEPGSGKSAAASMVVATAALDPMARLTLLDGKRVELACWAGIAQHVVGPSLDDAIDVLRLLVCEMEARYDRLLSLRKRVLTAADGFGLHLLVVDELAFYTHGPDRSGTRTFAELLRDFVARARAVAMPTIAATQKPSADVVLSYLRDLFGYRWAMRCSTPHASDTILGAGWAGQGTSAGTIDPRQHGVGYLLAEDDHPVRLRTCYLTDGELDLLARRAERLRGGR
jgi:DNA segregation ATPase FtsK/SpoIIIE-like protein